MRTNLFRRLVLLAVIAAPLTASMPAQGPGGMPPGPPPQGGVPSQQHSPAGELDHLIKAEKTAGVPLSDVQKVTILGILEDRETAMEALRKSGVTQAEAAEQARQLLTTSNESIRSALSEAQAKSLTHYPAASLTEMAARPETAAHHRPPRPLEVVMP